MKHLQSLITLFLLFLISTSVCAQSFSESRAVPAYAEIDKSSPSITLHWTGTPDAVSYKVFRRSLGSNNWGTAITNLPATDSSYEDTDVTQGTVYEYSIEKSTNTLEPFDGEGGNIFGYGYVSASINKDAVHSRGVLWVLIAKNINDSLGSEIDQLTRDLAADGWNVYQETIDTNLEVSDVKAFIGNARNGLGCDAVYLLGHIPVPYAGLYCQDSNYLFPPDGHYELDPNSHCGAWAADVYYGTIGANWTDDDSTTLAKRPENNNAIGDGKFDNARIPGTVSIAVGRVDFYNMPAFELSEIGLTKQYLNKAHDFKIATTQVLKQGIIENNFATLPEGFSSGAIRDFTAISGKDGIINADVFNTTISNDYLMSYTCGAGSYISCAGVGSTTDFTTKNAAAFNHIFGSFFGDYDIENNFMRASMATEKLGLVCIWSGRPKWITHTLAIGETYGDIALRSQNNWLDYDGNFYQNGSHVALLGDPSLRNDMLYPAANISLVTNMDRTEVDVTWDATIESDISGYFIYRSHKPSGKYVLINTIPISSTSFKDVSPYNGTNHYMVRVAKETYTGSGSYTNLSLGIVDEINGLNGAIARIGDISRDLIKVYPTLATDRIHIEKNSNSVQSFRITNSIGSEVFTSETHGKITSFSVHSLPSGAYFITINNKSYRFIKI
ncbi:MAG: hypothetical protein COA58_08995 [Bacteroidetes bacterium]|nr:MAG: hypothetical protein COA58_08995 [Bacteroidota bacterium]